MQTPDPWQVQLLREGVTHRRDILITASSQCGKTHTVALIAYLLACYGKHIIIVSPGDRQSMEFHERLINHHRLLGLVAHEDQPTKHDLKLVNGGRVRALPNSPDKVRSISAVDLIVMDEASRIGRDLRQAVSRMLATTGGQTIELTTPFGARGEFWQAWQGLNAEGEEDAAVQKRWVRHRIPWHMCPRIKEATVNKFRQDYGDMATRQEFLDCQPGDEFIGDGAGVFSRESFEGLKDPFLEVLR